MMFFIQYMQDIIIKNYTDDEITNIVLSHNGIGKNKNDVKKILSGDSRLMCLYTLRAIKECELLLEFDYKGTRFSKVVYDRLKGNSITPINIEIRDVDGEILTSTYIKYD